MHTRRRATRCRVLVTVVAGALFLSSCGGPGEVTPAANEPAAQPAAAPAATPPAGTTPQPAVSQAPPPAEATPAAAAAPAGDAAPPAANAMVQDHETGAEVTLVEARRTGGESVTVKWRYRNPTSSSLKLSKGGTSWLDAYQLTAEAFLVDPVNKKKYLVITDDQKYPLASKHGDWQGVTLQPGQALSAWAKFPAPPAEVDKLTVTLPGVAPFEDVPVIK